MTEYNIKTNKKVIEMIKKRNHSIISAVQQSRVSRCIVKRWYKMIWARISILVSTAK